MMFEKVHKAFLTIAYPKRVHLYSVKYEIISMIIHIMIIHIIHSYKKVIEGGEKKKRERERHSICIFEESLFI